MIYHYKLGLAQVESRLAEHRDRELKYCEKIKGLEFKTESSDEYIESLKKELELIKKEKEGLDSKLTGFQTASKDLGSLLESQRLDKNKEGLGYSSSCLNLLSSQEGYVLDCPTNSKIDKVEIDKKPPVKYAEQYRKPTKKPNVRGNQRNWNNLKSHQLGTSRSQNTTHKSFTPRPAAHKPYRPPMRPMRSNMNGARPNRTSFNKSTHSYTNRPFQRTSAVRSQYRAPWVLNVNRNFPPVNRKFSTVSRKFSTVNRKFPTANRKFPTGGTKFSTADMGKKEKAGSSQNNIDDKDYWDSGCSRHMTDNISYLSDYEPFDGGYVSFGQGGCKITGKGTIKTGKLKFENVYFMKDLKTPRQHNMYSIDLNNIIPHKDLTCLVAKAFADE
nr:hypothetical protein [Tanacetum cinerariifolium]